MLFRSVVVALDHLAGDLDVDGVDVVEEAGGEDATELEDEPGEGDEGERGPSPGAGRWSACSEGGRGVRNCFSRRHVPGVSFMVSRRQGCYRRELVGSASAVSN